MTIEILEDRKLLSVSVVEGYPGYYEFYGDDETNHIEIVFWASTMSWVADGQTGVEYDAAFASVFLEAGDDTVDVKIWGENVPQAAAVLGGAGDDTISINGGGAMWGETGNDTLRLENCFRGEVYGGPGDDKLYIVGKCADAEIDGHGGNDLIDATGSTYGVFATGGSENDTMYGGAGDDVLYGDGGADLLVGYGGHDIFYIDHPDGATDRVLGGGGVDVAFAIYGGGANGSEDIIQWGTEYVFYQ